MQKFTHREEAEIESHLISRSYEGFMRGVTIKGRRG